MTNEEMQRFSKDAMDSAMQNVMGSFGVFSKSAQAIAAEIAGYSKKSLEDGAAAWEKLMSAKSLDKALEVQSAYMKSSYEDFVAEATKLGELYADLAKEAYKPFESALNKTSSMT